MFRVTMDDVVLQRRFERYAKQIPFATRIASNQVARAVQRNLQIEATRAFDRPLPFTVKSPMVRYATKSTDIVAEVFLRDEATKGTPPVKYLEPQVQGGHRRVRRFERRLIHEGYMVKGEYAMPGPGAKLDSYGNVGPGQIVQILSQLKALGDVGQNESDESRSRAGANRSRYFATRAGNRLRPGVYMRVGPTNSARQRRIAQDATRQARKAGFNVTVKANRILPRGVRQVLIFTRSTPAYSKRFRFFEIAQQTWRRSYQREFDAAMRKAIQTSRR